jgi:cation diffusion facilitator family transporter
VAGLSRKSRAAAVSAVSNTALVVLKFAVGVVSHSVSILAEAIHSATDLFASLVAFASTRLSDRPSDAAQPYGHGRAESLSGAFEAALILAASVWIAVEAARRLVRGGEVEHLGLGVGVMAFAAAANAAVAGYLFRVARQEDSIAVEADAQHLATDATTSAGVACGLGVVWLTGWHALDPLVGLVVAAFVGHLGWQLTRRAGAQLMDERLPAEEVAAIESVLRSDPRVLGIRRLRTRRSGGDREVDVHVALPGEMTLAEAHRISAHLAAAVERLFPRTRVVAHLDPVPSAPPGGSEARDPR